MQKRIALVTGGMGGIGTAISHALYRAGMTVVASYNKGGDHDKALAWQKVQQDAGYHIEINYADITDETSAASLVGQIEERFGSLDVLINNAGITRDKSFKKMSLDQWHAVVQTNLDSVFNTTRHAINGMLERQYGRIINISSINGFKGQLGQTNYAAAKAGMHGFTKSLALEVAHKGITVNTISPGYIATPMVMAIDDAILAQIQSQIPVGRLGEPEEVARMVAFIADEASGFITGANFHINGGQYLL